MVLDRTPFYAEGGGQLADQGVIRTDGPSGPAEIEVTDVQTPLPGLIVHRGVVRFGEVTTGSPAHAEIDDRTAPGDLPLATPPPTWCTARCAARSASRRHRPGSENAPGRLRFDFTATGAVPVSVLREVEDEVNRVLINDLTVRAFHTSLDEARSMGALALFGEKYGSEVRIVEVGEYSRELCGGTHVARSGQLGLVKLLGESSIGSGVRRIEALVGIDAFRFLARESVLVSQLSEQLKARPEELPERISGVVSRLREAERELNRLRSARCWSPRARSPRRRRTSAASRSSRTRCRTAPTPTRIRRLALDVRGRIPAQRPGVVMITGVPADRPVVVIAVNEAGRAAGLAAGALVGGAARALGGGGGGKPDIAQGGGAPSAGDAAAASISAAFEAVRAALRDSGRTAR